MLVFPQCGSSGHPCILRVNKSPSLNGSAFLSDSYNQNNSNLHSLTVHNKMQPKSISVSYLPSPLPKQTKKNTVTGLKWERDTKYYPIENVILLIYSMAIFGSKWNIKGKGPQHSQVSRVERTMSCKQLFGSSLMHCFGTSYTHIQLPHPELQNLLSYGLVRKNKGKREGRKDLGILIKMVTNLYMLTFKVLLSYTASRGTNWYGKDWYDPSKEQ